jgi:hexosaminidase
MFNMKNLILICFMCLSFLAKAQQTPPIIPHPLSMEVKNGSFLIDNNVSIRTLSKDKAVADVMRFFTNYVKQITGVSLPQNVVKNKSIEFKIEKISEIGEEGYTLSVTPLSIVIKANTSKGLFYGVQSLMQTLPFIRTNQVPQIPCMEIKDTPRFAWRGFMLDVSRHFFSIEMIKEVIDIMASYKMNVFHWHLTDGPGWRLEIKKYPKLTEQAAWRIDDWGKPWNWAEVAFNADKNKATYGGYYTQAQAKEIVAYAAARNITVVPEIEMPGHSQAAMAAFPELSCHPLVHFGTSGDFYANKVEGNYCAGNDAAFAFLQDVLTEVMAIFPSKYIHVGGDEVEKDSWKKCSKCQARMKTEGLKDENELQSYFIRRMEKFLTSKNRKLIGWDEILEGGLAPEATVMSWRGEAGGIQAAKMKHPVVMSPTTPCYFDYYQGDPETEPAAFGGFNTLKKVYDYEPIPAEMTAEDAKYVLGAQANLWTEMIRKREGVEYMILPRLLALSEAVWSPKTQRNWLGFNQRLQPHMVGFEHKGLHYSKGNFKVDIKPVVENGKISISLESENTATQSVVAQYALKGVIHYTTDGSMPTTGSPKYDKPFEVNKAMTVKAALAVNNQIMTLKPAEQSFTFNKATGKNVQYATPFNKNYPANGANSLTDGFRGTKDHGKQWHSFSGKDMVATIDMGTPTAASSIMIGCLQNYGSWIFYPQSVKFEVSEDEQSFKEIKTVQNTIPPTSGSAQIQDFKVTFTEQKVKSIRITAKNLGVCPKGHPGEGGEAWIFLDEIIVE